jgi:methionyl-tRNA synthetase
MADPYYITTAIAYPNGKPHIGHAYEAIAADAIARFHRMQGKDVRLVTGTDEHGLKMAQTARAAGRDTLEFATEMSDHFRKMCKNLNVQYDDFCRTTEERHKLASIALWKALEAADDLYLDRYEGWYSVRDEAFYGEKELTEGELGEKLSPQGTPVEWTVEESWFFRLSKYRDMLIELNETPGFLEPESRRNEVLAFLKGNDLRDLSVSRTSFDWGVPVPGSPGHVMYVWVDALTTYLTGIGFPDREENFARFWPASLHLIGKDIVRFHAVYWPAFLKSAGLPVPKKIVGHGFLLARGGEKMSKSLGNVVDPIELAERFGVDPLRYFLLREVSFGQDGSYSAEAIVTRCNADLANNYGNLAQRCLSIIAKNCEGRVPSPGASHSADEALKNAIKTAEQNAEQFMNDLAIHSALDAIWGAMSATNQYFADQAPWAVRKSDPERADTILYQTAEAVRRLAIWSRWIMPESSDRVLDLLGQSGDARSFAHLSTPLEAGLTLPMPSGVFPRLEYPQETEV